MSFGTLREAGLALTVAATMALSADVWGQDAAWEGLINAGQAALQQQNFAEAERHFEEALEAAEKFPPGDARLGKSLNNLAAVYYAQKDYARAEPLMRRSVSVLEETLGPKSTDVAQSMKNLAALYYLQGNFADAEPLLKQALAILEEVHGPNHAYVATVLSNLAGLYQAQHRYADAEPLLSRSLEIWETLLGADHPDVVKSRTLLAQVRDAQARSGAAPAAAAAAPAATPAVNPDDDKLAAVIDEVRPDAPDAAAVPVPVANPLEAAASPAILPAASGAERPDQAAAGDTRTAALPAPAVGKAAFADSDIVGDPAKADKTSFAVYLSTLWSKAEAKRYWQALRRELPAVLDGKTMDLEEVALADGRGAFYRVLTSPYASDPDAEAACEQIRTQLRTHDCRVVAR